MDRLRLASSLRPFRAGLRAGLPAGLIAAALALFGAGGLRAAEPPTAFDLYLERGYTELAIYAATIAEDLAQEDHFIGKARAASDGQAVAPEQPTAALPPDMIDEALALRHRLATALGRGVAAREPLLAARAQVNFDCWLAQFPATEASEGSGDCRRQLQHTLALLDATATEPAAGPPADDVAPFQDARRADAATAEAATMDAATLEAMPAEPTEPSAEPAAPTAEPAASEAEPAASEASPPAGNAGASAPAGSDAAPAPGTLISVVIVGLPPGTPGLPGADTTDADRPDADEQQAVEAEGLQAEPAAGGAPDGEIAEAAAPRTVSQSGFGQGGFGYELRSEDRTVVGVSALASVIGPIGGLRAAPAAGLAGASVEAEAETTSPGTPEDATDESSGIHGVLSGIVDGIAGAFSNGSEDAGDSGSSDGSSADGSGGSADSSGGSTSGGDASSGAGGLGGTVDGALGGLGDAVGGLGDAVGGAVDGFGGRRSD